MGDLGEVRISGRVLGVMVVSAGLLYCYDTMSWIVGF